MFSSPLRLYNSLGRSLQEFVPLRPGKVHLYSCGPTVYDYAHIGNLRAYLFVDTLRRALQIKGYDVLHVMNVTDVGHLTSDMDWGEDKVEKAAAREGKSVWEIASFYTQAFIADLERLRVMPPSVWARATDHIQEMISFARVIEERGFAYVAEDGLYFDTGLLPTYGRLALLDVGGQKAGARVEPAGGKRNVSDFALWRFSPKDRQRLMEWSSPWGVGAPGWHLECSAMGLKYLGGPFDIHTGGVDHRQLHHVNEMAQNEAYLGDRQPGARFWLHNEFVLFGTDKMSKSSGEFVRLQDLVDDGIHPLAYRFFVLGATYRSPLRVSSEGLLAARQALERLLGALRRLKEEARCKEWLARLDEVRFSRGASFAPLVAYLAEGLDAAGAERLGALDRALSDDLNTPQALAQLLELAGQDRSDPDRILRVAAVYDLALGLGALETEPADLKLRPAAAEATSDEIEALILERNRARTNRDYARADVIRDQLREMGVLIKDTPAGTVWEWLPRR